MGTRCDLYVGRGEQAEWIGSYPFDGGPWGMPEELLRATDELEFRKQATAYLTSGGDTSTLPHQGWPWPWPTSATTDFAYAFDGGKVWASCFGCEWFDPLQERPHDLPKTAVFPDMSARQKVALGKRSGMITVVGGRAF